MKTLLILERKDLATIRKAQEEIWKAARMVLVNDDISSHLIAAKRLLDELLVEATHDQG